MLRILLQNLIGNSWKFTRNAPSPRIELSREDQGAEQVFVVRDNGAGFEMEYAHNLFLPFQRLHSPEEFEGTGVGLATVDRIVRRHRGRIWAASEPGRGAAFYFTLGAAPDAIATESP